MAKNLPKRIKQRINNIRNEGVNVLNTTNKKVDYANRKMNAFTPFDTEALNPKSGCSCCYFNGKEPILAIYPEDDGCYAAKEGDDFSYHELQNGLSSYLSTALCDFNSREAAQDYIQQLLFKVTDYLDEHMGETTPEKMDKYQSDLMGSVANKLDSDMYNEKYKKWCDMYSKVTDTEQSTVVGLEGMIDVTASQKAYLEVLKEARAKIAQLETENKLLSHGVGNIKSSLKEARLALDKERKLHSKQVQELTKELTGLEARSRQMEQEIQRLLMR